MDNESDYEVHWGWEREKLLMDIHQSNTNWPEKILDSPFSYVYEQVLTPLERRIVRLKIEGLVDGEIAIALKKELSSIKRHTYNIRRKYRLQTDPRVDNHPKIKERQYYKTGGKKGFIVHKRKHERNRKNI